MPTHKENSNFKCQISNWIFKFFLVFTVYFFFLSLLTSHFSLIYSISPLQQAQNDYSFQLSKLSDAYQKFVTAKANYQAFKTAVSKNEAFSKTKDYYLQVHNAYLSYFFLIEEKTNVFDWSLSSYKKDDIHNQLEKETAYIKNSLEKAQLLQTLEQIQSDSKSLEAHIIALTYPTTSRILVTSDIAQVEDSRSSYILLAEKIDNFVKDKINDSNRPLYQNWKSEIESLKNQLDLEIKDSKKILDQVQTIDIKNSNQALTQTFLKNSKQLLDRAKSLLFEILNFV